MVTRPFFRKTNLLVFAVMFVASMIAGSHLYSQDGDAPKGKPPVGNHGDNNGDDPMGKKKGPPPEMKERTPEDMADHMSTMLTDKLGLNDTQKKSVYDIVYTYATSHDRSTFDRKELDDKIRVVLTAEQNDKFDEFIKNGPPKQGPPPNIDEPGSK